MKVFLFGFFLSVVIISSCSAGDKKTAGTAAARVIGGAVIFGPSAAGAAIGVLTTPSTIGCGKGEQCAKGSPRPSDNPQPK